MGRDDLCITVPSFFRCPISLDVMKSPVSLCTGVTYDRSSIQRWLDGGHNTCPATMQILQTKDFVPNHNLQRLIRIWSDSSPARQLSDPTRSLISRDHARILIAQIQNPNPNSNNNNLLDAVTKLVSFAKDSDQNRKLLSTTDRFLPLLVEILTNCSSVKIVGNGIEELFVLVELVLREYEDRDGVIKSVAENRDRTTALMVSVLKQGSLPSRVAVARVLESVAADADRSKAFFSDDGDLVGELYRLMSTTESDSAAVESSLAALISIAKLKRIRLRLVRMGCVKVLGKLLLVDSKSRGGESERALRLLEIVASCKEGRAEMCLGEGAVVVAVVGRMMKVSARATESAVAVLWSLCYLFREEAAAEAVGRSNGVTKILLIMQSDCSPAVKQMAGDLLKVFRVNSKSCLSSYDTKTTHIMPF